MLQNKVTLAKLATDLTLIQALKWNEALHPRGEDGRFGSKAGEQAEAAGMKARASAALKVLTQGQPQAVAQEAQRHLKRLSNQSDQQNAAEKLVSFAQANPDKIAIGALFAAGALLGLKPKVIKDLLKSAKGEARVVEQVAKGRTKLPLMPSAAVIRQEKELASGAFGEVFKAKDQPIVYKLWKQDLPALTSSEREIASSQRAGELGIGPKVLQESDEGYAMEFLQEHETLAQKLTKGKLSDVNEDLQQVIDQLATLHQNGLTHGDLHLGNIMSKEGEVKIIDYGCSRALDQEEFAGQFELGKGFDVQNLINNLAAETFGGSEARNALEQLMKDQKGTSAVLHGLEQKIRAKASATMRLKLAEAAGITDLANNKSCANFLSAAENVTKLKSAVSTFMQAPTMEAELKAAAQSVLKPTTVQAAQAEVSSALKLRQKRKALVRRLLSKPQGTETLQSQIDQLALKIANTSLTPEEAYGLMAH